MALIASCGAIFLPGALIFGFPGVIGHHWQMVFNVGRAEIGQILFYVLGGVGIFMFLVGRLQERIAPAWIVALGVVVYSTGTILVGHAAEIKWVYVWAFATGAASATIYLPTLTVAQRWYPQRRGLVSGLVSMSFGISGAIMAPIFSYLFEQYGYVSMTLILGIGSYVIGLGSAVMIRLPQKDLPLPDDQETTVPSPMHSMNVWQSLRTRSFWILWFAYAFVGAGGIAMVTLSVNFGIARGLAMSEAVLILMSFNVTNGLSRLISGFLSDVFGRRTTMGLAFLIAGMAYLGFPYLSGIIIWSVLAAAIGFAFGTLFAVSAPLVVDCFGIDHFGSIFGLIFTAFGFVSGALGPWLSGYLLDISPGNFSLVFIYLGSLMLISALIMKIVTPYSECTF